MGKSRRVEEPEPHVNHERWLITYADMITLLMVLFIVMFAISEVNQKRFDELRDGLAASFGQQPSPFNGNQSVLQASGDKVMNPVGAQSQDMSPQSDTSPSASTRSTTAQNAAAAAAEVARLSAVRAQVEKALAAQGLSKDVAMRINQRGLQISLVSRHIVFAANVADLAERGKRVLDVLAPVLRALPNQIEIDGHTNQVKVHPKYYPTDWELSAARAVTVLRYLAEHDAVPQSRMSASAFGHERPLVNPSKPDAAELNKRVDVVVLSSAPEDTRKLFHSLAQKQNQS